MKPTAGQKEDFRFLENLSSHLKEFSGIEFSSLEQSKKDILEKARDEQERAQIEEMLAKNEKLRERLRQVRKARSEGQTSGQWLEKTVDEQLSAQLPEATEEDRQRFKEFLEQQSLDEIKADADALRKEMDET